MANSKPRGYFKYVLAVDVETSGMAYAQHSDDPSINPKTGDVYQVVSIGLIVADTATLKPVEELYLEIKWDGESTWSPEAEKVHGLSKSYLEKHGVDRATAVEEIGNLVVKYWGLDVPICLLGHNVATFDLWFFKRLMRSEGIYLRFGNRYLDSASVGLAAFGTFNSDDLFEVVGCDLRDPSKHNALEDARNALTAVRTVRQLFEKCING